VLDELGVDRGRLSNAIAIALDSTEHQDLALRMLLQGATFWTRIVDDDLEVWLGFGDHHREVAEQRAKRNGIRTPPEPTAEEYDTVLALLRCPVAFVLPKPQG
jgi:hypothetical protein